MTEDRQNSIDILEATHSFPCEFTFKVIGKNEDSLLERVLTVFRDVLATAVLDPAVRETPGGRHMSITINPHIESADCVLEIYGRLKSVEGVVMLI